MKIIIDKDKCKGHNNCISIAPNVFEVDEKFKAFVLDPKGDSDDDIFTSPFNASISLNEIFPRDFELCAAVL